MDTRPKREKPTPGCTPRWVHVEMRLDELTDAVSRFMEARKAVPQAWLDEYEDLRMALTDHNQEMQA